MYSAGIPAPRPRESSAVRVPSGGHAADWAPALGRVPGVLTGSECHRDGMAGSAGKALGDRTCADGGPARVFAALADGSGLGQPKPGGLSLALVHQSEDPAAGRAGSKQRPHEALRPQRLGRMLHKRSMNVNVTQWSCDATCGQARAKKS